MYEPLASCQQRYTRLLDAADEENIPNVREELDNIFNITPGGNYSELTTGTVKKRIYHEQFPDESRRIYSSARKLHRQAEDCILSDNTAPNLSTIHQYVIDVLKLQRLLMLNQPNQQTSPEGDISKEYQIFLAAILPFTELPPYALQKLIATLAMGKVNENVIQKYFHYMLDMLWLNATMQQEEKTMVKLMQELHFVSFKCYEKSGKFVVICKCMQSLWLRIQIYCERAGLHFWNMFNTSLSCYDEEFTLYALKFAAELQCYNSEGCFAGVHCERVQENMDFFILTWSRVMKNNALEETKMSKILHNVEDLLNLWLDSAKLDFYYLTWDYFLKRIDEVTALADGKSYHQLLLELEVQSNENVKSSGFLTFVRMLKRHLMRHNMHWNKFKGRIYTKFPPTRFAKLSDAGMQHVSLLLFAVAFVNYEEITGKLLQLLKELPKRRQFTLATWHVFMQMIRQQLENRKPITSILAQFGGLLDECALNRQQFHLLAAFTTADALPAYFRVADDLTLKQSLLIGAWLENYLRCASHNELIALLHTLSAIIERTVEKGAWYDYQSAFTTHVLATLRRLQHVDAAIVGGVAGAIVAHSTDVADAECLAHFVDHAPPQVMMSFFLTLRRKSLYNTSETREKCTIKAWLRLWLIGVENENLTREMVELLKLPTERVFENFLTSCDKVMLTVCLEGCEKFLTRHLNLQVYTNMALVLHLRGGDLYARMRTSCFLSAFVDEFLLPMEVLRGTRPSFCAHVEKTWHLYLKLLWQLYADVHGGDDPYLERLLKDLVVRYVPHFSSKQTPLLRVARMEHALGEFVYGKMAAEFFEYPRAKHVADEGVFKALNAIHALLDELLSSSEQEEEVMLYARSFLEGLFDVYMFRNHKVTVVDIVKKLAALRQRSAAMMALCVDSVANATHRHMAFNAQPFFQLAAVLAKIVPDVIRVCLPRIKDEIAIVECKRGQGFDNHLRQSYERLAKMLQ